LQRIIDAKIAGEEIVAPTVEAPPRVVNLMDALTKSLDAVSATKKKPAKVAVAQPAAKRKRAQRNGPYSKTAGVRPAIIREALSAGFSQCPGTAPFSITSA
jgi:hypothetical protein